MESITTEEVMDKIDMFQARFGKLDEFGCWDIYITQTDAGTKKNLQGVSRRFFGTWGTTFISGTRQPGNE